jgi:hypothetical protein
VNKGRVCGSAHGTGVSLHTAGHLVASTCLTPTQPHSSVPAHTRHTRADANTPP